MRQLCGPHLTGVENLKGANTGVYASDDGQFGEAPLPRAVERGIGEFLEQRVCFSINDTIALLDHRTTDGLGQMTRVSDRDRETAPVYGDARAGGLVAAAALSKGEGADQGPGRQSVFSLAAAARRLGDFPT